MSTGQTFPALSLRPGRDSVWYFVLCRFEPAFSALLVFAVVYGKPSHVSGEPRYGDVRKERKKRWEREELGQLTRATGIPFQREG